MQTQYNCFQLILVYTVYKKQKQTNKKHFTIRMNRKKIYPKWKVESWCGWATKRLVLTVTVSTNLFRPLKSSGKIGNRCLKHLLGSVWILTCLPVMLMFGGKLKHVQNFLLPPPNINASFMPVYRFISAVIRLSIHL